MSKLKGPVLEDNERFALMKVSYVREALYEFLSIFMCVQVPLTQSDRRLNDKHKYTKKKLFNVNSDSQNNCDL